MQHRSRSLAAGILSIFLLAHCECDPDLQVIAPKIELSDPAQPELALCSETDEGGLRCEVDFGEVAIGDRPSVRLLVKNPSPVDLLVESMLFTESSDPAFDFSFQSEAGAPGWPATVPASGAGEALVLTFAPVLGSTVSATLEIRSDAANLQPEALVEVVMKGTGVDRGLPELVIDPSECNFGRVGVGVTAFCDLTFENTGTRDLEISSVGFSDDTPTAVFGAASVIAVPVFIAPGTGVSVRLYASPDAIGEQTGKMEVTSNDPMRPSATVPLRVEGAQAPTAVARVLSVNGVPNNQPAPAVQPLDDVVLTGVDSVPADPAGSIVGYQWEIVQKPNESSAQLTTPNQMTTQLYFSSSFGNVSGVDVAGTFVIRLTVTDSYGAQSTNDARVTLNAVPSEALHLQLTWDTPVNDIDFHLKRGANANYCGNTGCYYMNCEASSSNHLEWDGMPGRSAGDPSLDIDDMSGYGPENINIDSPVDGLYTIGVHFFSGSTPTFATVKIFINGALREEYSRELLGDDDFWEVATVQWQSGNATVTPVNDFWGDSSCPHRGP